MPDPFFTWHLGDAGLDGQPGSGPAGGGGPPELHRPLVEVSAGEGRAEGNRLSEGTKRCPSLTPTELAAAALIAELFDTSRQAIQARIDRARKRIIKQRPDLAPALAGRSHRPRARTRR